MKYSEHRNKIRSGDIIATSHAGWTNLHDIQCQIVRLFQESEYCHVGLVWKVSGRLFVIESVKPVVRLVPLSKFVKEGFYHVPLKKPISSEELEFALSTVGVGEYSTLQAVTGFLKDLKIGEDRKWQCAEWLITSRKISGVDLGDVATPSAVVKKALELGYELSYVQGE